ncbi:FG-GAP-like repeat-containing protein [Streptomyces sp. H10-C2]|uniref:FG-GAP-like repeat-containing protein n=1 Tax=unclassified Streptomyces TaxID=2593676 RepID=UPI0024B8DAD2|nr:MULTISPECIES: FG-GAP-like repeat-containing protein [unclassified Streptomyces]MDJ0346525.1 FG-GAP-like repeat-containing protein [Streptomyces sp. PH10-H1]MDJ0375325.1 FG-GAP-like repeat-containing protein [Streptomyces sp. H10-C2]
MTGFLVPVTASAAARPAAAKAAVTTVADDGSVSEEDQALALAQSTGQPAEVLSVRTELSDEWANVDGTFSVKRYGSPVRLFRDGTWVKTDPTLVFAADGSVVPTAATVAVTFSGGGTGPLLSGVKDGRTLTLSWPTALPKPALAGNIATYAEVLPGVDMQLKAEVEGFSQLLVIKTAVAASNPQLATLNYKMATAGLTVTTDSGTGTISAVNPAGQSIFTSSAPLMWDSTSTGSAPAAAMGTRTATTTAATTAAPSDVFEPAAGAKDAQMPASVSGDTLSITPDQALLTGTTTQYPVFIDPSWAWGNRQNWLRAYRSYPDAAFWNANEDARVGHESDTNGLSRSFFQMDISNIKGAGVISSTFRIKNKWSWSCQARPVELWQTGPISKKTTWNNQPAKITKLYTVNDSKGWRDRSGSDSSCPAGNLEFDATAKVKEAASKNWPSLTLGMYAFDESDTYGWKRFDPKTAVLETKYNHPPKTPYSLGTNPKTDCATGGLIGNTRVSLHATIDDPDAGNLSAQFLLYRTGTAAAVVDQSIPALKGRVATLALPEASTPTGDYTWMVRAKDNQGEYSGWSTTCKFSLDRTRPARPPVINSPVFPNGDNGWPTTTGKARTQADFTLAANGVTDAVQYGWYTDYNPQVNYTNVTAGASATVKITPPGYGPHFAYAFSIDRAGNRSDTAIYTYYAGRSTSRDIPGDLNGDGNNDIWNVDSNGTLLTYAGQGNSQFSAATNGGQALDGAQVASRGDWGQDGYNDLIALQYDTTAKVKQLWVYPNNGSGTATTNGVDGGQKQFTVACPVVAPPSDDNYDGCATGDDHWRDADQILTPGDLNGDGEPDVLVKEGKFLWAYYGDRATKRLDLHGTPVLVGGNDWDTFTVVAPGDLNGDGLADLWLRNNATGHIFRTYGKQGENKGTVNPTTWGDTAGRVDVGSNVTAAAFPVIGSSGDVTGDGIPDLWARKTDNTMTGWPGVKTGTDFTGFGTVFAIDGITGGSRIPSGTTLTSGQTFTSRSAKLTMKSDGNLVITNASSLPNAFIWSTGTAGNTGAKAVMQADGNLVVYKADGSTKAWESKTSAPGGYALLQDRGNLIVYNVKGQSLWSSGTHVRHDYNGDGRSDMAALYSHADGSYELYDFIANSDGTFPAPYKGYTAPAGSGWAANMKYATGDYNGDGRGDVAILYGYDNGGVRLFTALGNASGGFDKPVASWYREPGNWWFSQMSLQSGDFNGDGRDDLAVWYDYTDGHDTLFTFTANPQGGFNEPFASWTATPGNWELKQAKLAIGDYKGDGRDDLAVFYGYGDMNTVKMHTFLTSPTGAFAYTSTSWTSTTWGNWNQAHIQAGDFNGDGKDDIAAWYDYSSGSDSLNTFISLGTTTGTFQAPYSAWSTPAGNYWYDSMPQMVAGDYNGDGRDDLGVMYGYGTGSSRMFTWTAKNTGTTADDGHFNDSVASWSSATDWPTGAWANKDVHFFNTHS